MPDNWQSWNSIGGRFTIGYMTILFTGLIVFVGWMLWRAVNEISLQNWAIGIGIVLGGFTVVYSLGYLVQKGFYYARSKMGR